jgi:hypothetical protein
MRRTVPFKPADADLQEKRTYHPVPIPVRGEVVAWSVSAVLGILGGILIWRTGMLPVWVLIFLIIMLLLVIAIRFSRWMEVNTSIELNPGGIRYANPLRTFDLGWADLQRVVASQAGSGWRIYVFGGQGGFRFQTATKLYGVGGAEVRTGYPEGVEIMAHILRNNAFGEPHFDEPNWVWEIE